MLYSAFARRYLDVDSQSGDDWQCLCPFHRDKRPSFNFNVRRGVFICYACGERGGIEKLMEHMAIRQVPDPSLEDVQSALEKLKPEKEARIYPELWLERFKIDWRRDVRAVEHLNGRHLKRELIEQWGIGYEAATDSITIPIRNRDGALIGVYRRSLKANPKQRYKYPIGFRASQNLFGFSECERKRPLVVCEGAFDALPFWNVGYQAVAVYGSNLSAYQVKLISGLSPSMIINAADNDGEEEVKDDGEIRLTKGLKLTAMIERDLVGFRLLRMPYKGLENDPGDIHPLVLRKRLRELLRAV